jgi:putative ABC transport system permease protein
VLLGLACGIAALRLYPLPLGIAAGVARRGRGLAVHLGLSRAARQSEVTSLPLLVLILALAVAVFSATMLRTLETGQDRTAWRSVGADVRVDAPPDTALPGGLVTRLKTAGEVAPAYVQDVDLAAGDKTPVLLALDLPAYERVVAGTPGAVRLAPGLDKPPPIPGTVPALVSANWPEGSFFQVAFPDRSLNLVSIGSRSSLPGIPRGQPFVVVSLRALRAAGERPAPNRVYLRDVGAGAARRAVLGAAPGARITSRSAVARGLRASPLVGGVLDGFRGAIVVAAIYAAIAVALLALLAARSRSRDLALVRTMGGTGRDTLVLAAVELAPLVAVGLVLGIGLGVAIPHLIAPGLQLGFFTGGGSTIAVSWLPPLLVAAGVLLVLAVSVGLTGARARRTRLNAVLRIGER